MTRRVRMTRWVVVGGGSAGCVIAARLSEVRSNEVVLLEAGPAHAVSADPAGVPVLDDPSRLDGCEVIRRHGSAPERYPQGWGLGGSSLVNAAVVVGDPGEWSSGHELPVDRVDRVGAVGSAVLAATPDAGAVGLIGRGARRATAADVYLRPAEQRENLTVRSAADVTALAFDGRRCVGVFTADGEHVAADRVVLCAGAIGTPTLLLRSGVDTPGVGAGLQDHVGASISFDLLAAGDPEVPAIGVTVERPGRQIVVLDRLPAAPTMGALIAGHLAVSSVGRISVPDPDGPSVVELRQLSGAGDLDGLVRSVTEAFELLDSRHLRSVIGAVYIDDHGTRAEEIRGDPGALREWLPTHLGGYHHLAGSCRLGTALDDDGSLRGYEAVSVCDASALHGVPDRNPYLTVIRLAERIAAAWTA